MAFAGTFFSQIGKVIDENSNSNTSAEQLAKLFGNGGSNSNESSNANRYNYTKVKYDGVLESDLTSLTTAQKNIFIVILTILFVLSLCGNVCTLFVNFRRKIRPFFRACLISLAFSDLMNTVFLTASYLSQFTADFLQIWSLGNVMCSLVPFATTCAILASSMTLVGIALDRYFAVMKAVIGFWNPSVISCIACMLCIWLASISIACPVFTYYGIIPMYIFTKEYRNLSATNWSQIITDARTKEAAMNVTASPLLPTNTVSVQSSPHIPHITFSANFITSPVTTMKSMMPPKTSAETKTPWEMETALQNFSFTTLHQGKLINVCMSEEKNVSVYYIIVFTIIFVPCIVAFFWFNTIIAQKLWERRHLAGVTKQKSCRAKNKAKSTTTCPPSSLELTQTERPQHVLIQNKTCTCKPIQVSSSATSPPTSVSNTLCGKIKTTTSSCPTNSNADGVKITANQCREAKHLRMFTIILLMMAVFVILRLPAWIFLLMRMYGKYSTARCWILYFIFGLMNLTSSVLNPLFYTFLTEALKYVLKLKDKVSSLHCVRFLQSSGSCGKRNLTSGCRSAILCWHQPSTVPDHKYITQANMFESETHSKDCMKAINNDKDEGVECNDDVDDENICSIHNYSQRVYTIYPSSLVSSSISSQN